jgi:hypothetical protein
MSGNKTPGPVCQVVNPVEFDEGTMCVAASALPGATCSEQNSALPYSGLVVMEMSRPGAPQGPAANPASALPELGALSARYESSGNPGAIGYDSTGGWTYGTYQLATIPGTFDDFIHFLEVRSPKLAKPLNEAGGSDTATRGSKKFRAAWVKLAHHDGVSFGQAQYDFIKTTHYDRQVAKLKGNFGIDIDRRSRALQNVVWSMAVQHGNGTQIIFKNALQNTKASGVNDAEMIDLLYAERSKVNIYFASSKKTLQAAVKKRFHQEERDALRMLQRELAATKLSASGVPH